MSDLRQSDRTNALYDPFRDMFDLETTVFGRPFGSWGYHRFRTDVIDDNDSYRIEADMPGFDKKDIRIDIDGDRLFVNAERHCGCGDSDRNDKYVRCERSFGRYFRSFDISGVREEGIKADYRDGVLHITLPKKTDSDRRKRSIDIQ